ncbi:hypothetical protein [Ammoniphilus sp. 3BR4]
MCLRIDTALASGADIRPLKRFLIDHEPASFLIELTFAEWLQYERF